MMDWGWLGLLMLAVFGVGFAVFAVFAFACLIADLLNEWRN